MRASYALLALVAGGVRGYALSPNELYALQPSNLSSAPIHSWGSMQHHSNHAGPSKLSEQHSIAALHSNERPAKLSNIYVLRLSMILRKDTFFPCTKAEGLQGLCKRYYPWHTAAEIRRQLYGSSDNDIKFRHEGELGCTTESGISGCKGSVLEVFCESANVGNEQDCREFGMMESVEIKDVNMNWLDDDSSGFWDDLDPLDPGLIGNEAAMAYSYYTKNDWERYDSAFCNNRLDFRAQMQLKILRWFKKQSWCARVASASRP